jgi:hypothetical protein
MELVNHLPDNLLKQVISIQGQVDHQIMAITIDPSEMKPVCSPNHSNKETKPVRSLNHGQHHGPSVRAMDSTVVIFGDKRIILMPKEFSWHQKKFSGTKIIFQVPK